MIRQTVILGAPGGTLFLPISAVLLIAGILALFLLPRRFALAAILVPVFLISMYQRLELLGIDFTTFRIFIFLGMLRILVSGDWRGVDLSGPIDRAVYYYGVVKVVTFVLLWMSMPALINHLGYFVDDVGGYVLCRWLIRDRSDAERALGVLGFLCVTFAGVMVYENVTARTALWWLGAPTEALIREGKVRAVASFGHPVLAGTFGGTLLPIFWGYWVRPGDRFRLSAAIATATACVMVLTTHSSGPDLTLIAAVIGLLAWPLRGYTRAIKRTLILGLVGLQLVMHDPVWALLFKVKFIGGGSGYHRYQLIDQSVKHFWDWWLIGTKDNGLWGIDMWDLANNYVAVAVGGGLISLILFLLIIHRAYAALSGWRAAAAAKGDKAGEWGAWTFTVALFAHSVAYFGIGYFDQTKVLWVVFLAVVIAMAKEQEAALPVALPATPGRLQRSYVHPMGYRPAPQWSPKVRRQPGN